MNNLTDRVESITLKLSQVKSTLESTTGEFEFNLLYKMPELFYTATVDNKELIVGSYINRFFTGSIHKNIVEEVSGIVSGFQTIKHVIKTSTFEEFNEEYQTSILDIIFHNSFSLLCYIKTLDRDFEEQMAMYCRIGFDQGLIDEIYFIHKHSVKRLVI